MAHIPGVCVCVCKRKCACVCDHPVRAGGLTGLGARAQLDAPLPEERLRVSVSPAPLFPCAASFFFLVPVSHFFLIDQSEDVFHPNKLPPQICMRSYRQNRQEFKHTVYSSEILNWYNMHFSSNRNGYGAPLRVGVL